VKTPNNNNDEYNSIIPFSFATTTRLTLCDVTKYESIVAKQEQVKEIKLRVRMKRFHILYQIDEIRVKRTKNTRNKINHYINKVVY
jgi:hypothetical protein